MKISARPFGKLLDGQEVFAYTLENNDMHVEILNYGGIVRCLKVPDRGGALDDVVLGYDTLEPYLQNPCFFGALVGRNANRIANAKFSLFDEDIQLAANDGANNLHSGGATGLGHRLFSSEVHTFNNLPALLLTHTMDDGSDGFPGNLIVTIAYALTEDNALMIDYRAVCDRSTVINLTNHSYFNLAGHHSGNILDHALELAARFYTPNTDQCLPTGAIAPVRDTPFDFTTPRPLGERIGEDHDQLTPFRGYDHNFVLDGTDYRKVAALHHPGSGRVLTVLTDLPGMQLYTGNFVDETGKSGAKYGKHSGVCLETQLFPNAPNTPWFPSSFYAAGEEYTSTTTFQFSTI